MSGGWGTPSWMGGDPVAGETFVGDKTSGMARALLNAAKALDLDPSVVRAVTGGFIAPDAVYEHAEAARLDADTGTF